MFDISIHFLIICLIILKRDHNICIESPLVIVNIRVLSTLFTGDG